MGRDSIGGKGGGMKELEVGNAVMVMRVYTWQ